MRFYTTLHFVAFIYQNSTITEASLLQRALGYQICNCDYVTILCFLALLNLLGFGFLIFKIVGKHVGYSRPQRVFIIKFYWHTATLICVCLICGCLHTTVAELNSCNRHYGPQSLKYFFSGSSQKKLAESWTRSSVSLALFLL